MIHASFVSLSQLLDLLVGLMSRFFKLAAGSGVILQSSLGLASDLLSLISEFDSFLVIDGSLL